jgi:hypothetical protein
MPLRPLVLALALLLAPAATARAGTYLPPPGKVFAGVSGGGLSSFDAASGKQPPVIQSFAAWDSTGTGYLTTARQLDARSMIHISTRSIGGREAITPRGIAMGHGDSHLLYLNRTMAQSDQVVYVRLMAEMNGSWNPYSAYNANGTPRNRSHSTRNFKKAWRRVVLILRGGDVAQIDARLHRLHMPRLRGVSGALPTPKVSFLWDPEVWGDPNLPGNAARAYWPGARFVDWVGTDFYSKFPNYRGLNAFYGAFRGKPFAFGEWALWGHDDPAFVRGLFSWIRSHRRVRMVMYNQGTDVSRSPFLLARYPRSAAVLREELASSLFAPLAPEFLAA